jgi:protein TonB
METTLSPLVTSFLLQGHQELKSLRYKYTSLSLLISSALSFSVMGGYHGITYWLTQMEEAPTVRLRVLKYTDLGPPPSIANTEALPQVGVSATNIKPSIGIPVPVPDAQVSPDQTFATQTELSKQTSPTQEDLNTGEGNVAINQDISIDEEPGVNDFVPFEKEPQVALKVKPEYPDIALRAGIEGAVFVKVLVGKDGKPKKVVVLKETPENVFTDSAKRAAMQYLFTPAMMNTGPVQVWVTISFKFRIRDVSS